MSVERRILEPYKETKELLYKYFEEDNGEITEEVRNIVSGWLSSLDEHAQNIFKARYRDDWKCDHIIEKFHVSRATYFRGHDRAIIKLKERLDKQGIIL